MAELKPEDYFLPPTDPGNDLKFRMPFRKGTTITPIVDGIPTFTAMEEAIAAATKSVHIASWIFNPDTPLQSSRVKKSGVKTWAQLLRTAAARGATVRILLSDFDPILGHDLHEAAWSAHRRLVAQAAKLKPKDSRRFQVICSRHNAELGTGISGVLLPVLTKIVAGLNGASSTDAALKRFRDMPGLWASIDFVKKTNTFRTAAKPTLILRPAVHHQKLCVVDGTLAFAGGLDVNTGRIDTPSHTKSLWHDIDVSCRNELAADIDRLFCARWNAEEPLFTKFVLEVNAAQPGFTLLPTLRTAAAPAGAGSPGKGTASAQLLRTVSSDAVISTEPNVIRKDIQETYEKVIGTANSFVYIENQYVRAPEIAVWLIKRHAQAKDLQVIIVLPVAPEEVAQKGGADEATMHGLFLQHKVLTDLRTEFKGSLGIYSMVQAAPADASHKTDSCGSHQIYVHTKALIVDDVFALVGSANATDRSFRVDTEMAVSWFDPASVRAFRQTVWGELLGSPKGMSSWAAKDYVKKWEAIAKANATAVPSKRSGFVVPHNPEKFKGRKSDRVPDAFAELFNVDLDRGEAMRAVA